MSAISENPNPDVLRILDAKATLANAIRDKSYQSLPLGRDVAEYLRHKRKRLTTASERVYEAALAQLVLYFPTLSLGDFELPAGLPLLERFLDDTWGGREPRTYNKNLTVMVSFFDFWVRRQQMRSNPASVVEKAKPRDVHREILTRDQVAAIFGTAQGRDRVAVRLLLTYGLRQGSFLAVQFKHFDHQRKRLTVFSKGGKVRTLPIPEPSFWMDLERLILDQESQPEHFLMPGSYKNQYSRREIHTRPMSNRACHYWWYLEILGPAGVVRQGTTSGMKMHMARHTAGQRLLDATKGDLKAVQKLLGHASIQTTGDVYVDYDNDQWAQKFAESLKEEDDR